jgi:hypothetical protein
MFVNYIFFGLIIVFNISIIGFLIENWNKPKINKVSKKQLLITVVLSICIGSFAYLICTKIMDNYLANLISVISASCYILIRLKEG